MAERTSHDGEISRAKAAERLRAIADELDAGRGPARVTVGNKEVRLSPPDVLDASVTVTERSRRLRKDTEELSIRFKWNPIADADRERDEQEADRQRDEQEADRERDEQDAAGRAARDADRDEQDTREHDAGAGESQARNGDERADRRTDDSPDRRPDDPLDREAADGDR